MYTMTKIWIPTQRAVLITPSAPITPSQYTHTHGNQRVGTPSMECHQRSWMGHYSGCSTHRYPLGHVTGMVCAQLNNTTEAHHLVDIQTDALTVQKVMFDNQFSGFANSYEYLMISSQYKLSNNFLVSK